MKSISRIIVSSVAALSLCLIIGCNHDENNTINRIDLNLVESKIAEHDNISVRNIKLTGAQYQEEGDWFILYKIYTTNNTLEPLGGAYGVGVRINQSGDYTVDFIRW